MQNMDINLISYIQEVEYGYVDGQNGEVMDPELVVNFPPQTYSALKKNIFAIDLQISNIYENDGIPLSYDVLKEIRKKIRKLINL